MYIYIYFIYPFFRVLLRSVHAKPIGRMQVAGSYRTGITNLTAVRAKETRSTERMLKDQKKRGQIYNGNPLSTNKLIDSRRNAMPCLHTPRNI